MIFLSVNLLFIVFFCFVLFFFKCLICRAVLQRKCSATLLTEMKEFTSRKYSLQEKKNVNGTTLQTDIVLGHDTVHHLESITLGTVKCISENIILMYHEILPSNLKQISDILYGELTCRAYLTGVTSE